jgi:protein-disulfide isomerase
LASKTISGRARQRRRGSTTSFPLILAGVVIASLVAVAVLIGVQAATGSDDSIPPRVAQGDGRVLGDPNAPVTIVEYADFQCPVCKRAASTVLADIEREYVATGKVKIEFRMYPFLGQESFDAAQAAEAARDQGKFWEYHDALFNAQGRENSGTFSYDRLVAIARETGLDVPLFEQTLSSNVHFADIQAEADSAREAGIVSTPTFFVGDEKIVGAQPYAVFQAAISQALQEAGAQ